MHIELMAQLIEITSIGVAGKALKKPIQIPRPGHIAALQQGAEMPGESGQGGDRDNVVQMDAYARGISVLAGSARPVRREAEGV